MKNIKNKVFAILAAAVILIGAGAGAGAGILPTPDASGSPGVKESALPPTGSSRNGPSTNGDYDDVINLGI